MKPTKKQIEEFITLIAGIEGLKVYKHLKGKENINEFDIIEKLKITINQLRVILYKLDKYALLSSKRRKDRKKGWYIYFWTLHNDKLTESIIAHKKKKLAQLENLLDLEKDNEFYVCENKCIRLNAQEALESDYFCEGCGSMLNLEKNKSRITKIKKQILELKKELKI